MATYTWPLALPQVPQKSFNEELGLNIIRTPVDMGPAKMRRRSLRPDVLNVSFLMTTDQVEILDQFINNTLMGTIRFNFMHPRKNVEVEVRVVPKDGGTLYSLQYAAPEYYTVTLQLEVLP